MTLNKFGLSRSIPEEVKRQVRKRCGFGCVRCGSAIYQYEHFNPEFSEATIHDVNGITLLCGGCHDLKTRDRLSIETLIKLNDNPKCLEQGFSKGPFDVGTTHPEIVLGTLIILNVPIPLQMFGEPILKITPPLQTGEVFKISARLRDQNGNISLEIEDNEWLTPVTYWDCEVEGQRISLRSKARELELILRVEPPTRIVIERLNMMHLGNKITCEEKKNLKIERANGMFVETFAATIDGSKIGIDINDNNFSMGVGGGKMHIGLMKTGRNGK